MIKTLFKFAVPTLAFAYIGSSCEIAVPCDTIDCGPNGTCVDGACLCTEGYTGTLCDEAVNQPLYGEYDANQQCVGYEVVFYIMTLSQGQNSGEVILGNFSNLGVDVAATLANNQLTIDSQTINVPGNGDMTVSGTGIIDGSEITLNCTYQPPGQLETTCIITYTASGPG